MADPASFLARWSRLKRQARKPQALANEAAPNNAPALEADTPPSVLPAIESLTAESDYKIFMQPGVSDAARNEALQKLWRSNPVFANLDGLVEYGEDYAAAFKASAAVRTAYRVAQGMAAGEPPAADVKQQAIPANATSTKTDKVSDSSAKDSSDVHEVHVERWTDA